VRVCGALDWLVGREGGGVGEGGGGSPALGQALCQGVDQQRIVWMTCGSAASRRCAQLGPVYEWQSCRFTAASSCRQQQHATVVLELLWQHCVLQEYCQFMQKSYALVVLSACIMEANAMTSPSWMDLPGRHHWIGMGHARCRAVASAHKP
jgi:hypothetical protein